MIDALLVPKTVVNAKGDGPSIDVSGANHRIFLLTLRITNIIEQESLDVSIYGSVDGTTRIAGYKAVPDLPLVVAVSYDRAAVLEPWFRHLYLSLPLVVRVAGALTPELVTSPAPASEPIVWSKPPRSMVVPALTVNALDEAKAPAVPPLRVPPETVVVPP